MVGRWHCVRGGRFDENQDDREFRMQGPLVSIGREPPQNSTDNPLSPDSPVILRYSMRNISSTPEMRETYFPQNPWIDHITCPENDDLMTYVDDYDSTLTAAIGGSVKVLLVEDYNATGLVGDPNKLFPTPDGRGGYDRESVANTFFWFMRSQGSHRPITGRGGSWGLGKLAFPLASAVRTFFVVTTRQDGSRHLAGQAVLKNHYFREWWESMMYFAQDDLIGHSPHHWGAISDDSSVDNFCSTFKVERGNSQPGTSMVIPLPKAVLNLGDLALCLLSNYCVPIMEGKLVIELSKEDGHLDVIDASNIRGALASELPWDRLPRYLSGSRVPNPAWTTKERMGELIRIYESMKGEGEEHVELTLGTPTTNSAPDTNEQFDRILPERGSEELDVVRDAFQTNQIVSVRGQIPVHHRVSGDIEYGSYDLVLRKCEDPFDAEAHFYRDQISLPLNLDKKPASEGVSSLLIISGEQNPLAELLRQSEGPAHLKWDPRENRMKRQYEYGPTTISFLKQIVSKIVNRITSVQSEKEDIWTDIFSLGEVPPPPEPIDRRFRIVEQEHGGFTITPLEESEELSGRQFTIRVGYPKPFKLKVGTPPDHRAIDVHPMSWDSNGATITRDVAATDGNICLDRVRMTITDPDFEVELHGLDTELKAQVIVTEEVNQ